MKNWITAVATGMIVLSYGSPLVAEASFHSHSGFHTSHVSTGGGFHSSAVHTGSTHVSTGHYHGIFRHSSGNHYHVKSTLPKTRSHHLRGLKPARLKKTYKLSNKPVKEMSHSEQSRVFNRIGHAFSKDTSRRVFADNNLSDSYRRGFYWQSIIGNPWFWMFMYEHHRLNQDSQHDNEYLMGYRDGAKDAKKKLADHQKTPKPDKTPAGSTPSYDNGYRDGFNDVIGSKN